MPLFALISGLLLITQGPDILYRGARLGRDQREFHILKFRTLATDKAKALTSNRALPANSGIETPLGEILRDTRLDELPQLFNILKGDMNICGPRPVRDEIAAIERARIPDYDARFRVSPGLVGPTQACFGHGASKRVRARMNNQLVRQRVDILAEIALFARIAFSMALRVAEKAGRVLFRPLRPIMPKRRANIWLVGECGWRADVEDIAVDRLRAPHVPEVSPGVEAVLHIRLKGNGVRKARITLQGQEWGGVFAYEPGSEFSANIIERYALGRVVLRRRLHTVRATRVSKPNSILTPAWSRRP